MISERKLASTSTNYTINTVMSTDADLVTKSASRCLIKTFFQNCVGVLIYLNLSQQLFLCVEAGLYPLVI